MCQLFDPARVRRAPLRDRYRRRLLVQVLLTALGLLYQRGRGLEALAIAFGQLARPSDECRRSAAVDRGLVAVDVLEHAARPAGEANPEDRADVGVGDRFDHTLVEAL